MISQTKTNWTVHDTFDYHDDNLSLVSGNPKDAEEIYLTLTGVHVLSGGTPNPKKTSTTPQPEIVSAFPTSRSYRESAIKDLSVETAI